MSACELQFMCVRNFFILQQRKKIRWNESSLINYVLFTWCMYLDNHIRAITFHYLLQYFFRLFFQYYFSSLPILLQKVLPILYQLFVPFFFFWMFFPIFYQCFSQNNFPIFIIFFPNTFSPLIAGCRPLSVRSFRHNLYFVGYNKIAYFLPRWLKYPAWLLTLSGHKF